MTEYKYKIVKITWTDSHRYTYQMEDIDDVDIAEIQSVGILLSKDKSKVILCQDYIYGDYRGVIAIPKENIVEIEEIGVLNI